MDIMYTETDIRKDTSQQVFQRGKWLYQSGNVQHIQIQDVYIEETPCKKIKAYVQGSSWRCYNTEVVVDEEAKELHSYRCECPAHVESVSYTHLRCCSEPIRAHYQESG